MSYATLDDLRAQLGGRELSPEYRAKMLHDLPLAKSVDREAFILKHCAGKRVLEFGASGKLHEQIKAVASDYFGVDREAAPGVEGFDLDEIDVYGGGAGPDLPQRIWDGRAWVNRERPDIIICGEVLEHLSNPGWFLTRLHRQYAGIPTIITVPNAFSSIQQRWVAKGIECVNPDHVSWYSPKTLSVLLQRAGYVIGEFFWYHGDGPSAEGMVVCVE